MATELGFQVGEVGELNDVEVEEDDDDKDKDDDDHSDDHNKKQAVRARRGMVHLFLLTPCVSRATATGTTSMDHTQTTDVATATVGTTRAHYFTCRIVRVCCMSECWR